MNFEFKKWSLHPTSVNINLDKEPLPLGSGRILKPQEKGLSLVGLRNKPHREPTITYPNKNNTNRELTVELKLQGGRGCEANVAGRRATASKVGEKPERQARNKPDRYLTDRQQQQHHQHTNSTATAPTALQQQPAAPTALAATAPPALAATAPPVRLMFWD